MKNNLYVNKLRIKGIVMSKKYEDYQKKILETILHLVKTGYVQGTGGNVSIKIKGEDALAITPSQIDYFELTPKDICIVDFNLNPLTENRLKPSMETGMHIAVYKNRQDISSVVHTHQIYASIFSIINQSIPALFDEVTSSIGSTVDVIPYALSGSKELAKNVEIGLNNGCNCFILQNHGAISLGKNIKEAVTNAKLLEKTAEVYYHAIATGKKIYTLPKKSQEHFQNILQKKQELEINKKN